METLLVFGANINALDANKKTPLDLVEGPSTFLAHQSHLALEMSPISPNSHRPLRKQHTLDSGDIGPLSHSTTTAFTSHFAKSEDAQTMIDTLKKYGAERGKAIISRTCEHHHNACRVAPFQDMTMMDVNERKTTPVKVRTSGPSDNWTTNIAKYNYVISNYIERKILSINHHIGQCSDKTKGVLDETMAVVLQLRELKMLRDAGSRVLFLDGGGMKGLAQIEILNQLEEQTGRRITELFDWIVGTSTGGIIALALVYGKTYHPLVLCVCAIHSNEPVLPCLLQGRKR